MPGYIVEYWRPLTEQYSCWSHVSVFGTVHDAEKWIAEHGYAGRYRIIYVDKEIEKEQQ